MFPLLNIVARGKKASICDHYFNKKQNQIDKTNM